MLQLAYSRFALLSERLSIFIRRKKQRAIRNWENRNHSKQLISNFSNVHFNRLYIWNLVNHSISSFSQHTKLRKIIDWRLFFTFGQNNFSKWEEITFLNISFIECKQRIISEKLWKNPNLLWKNEWNEWLFKNFC